MVNIQPQQELKPLLRGELCQGIRHLLGHLLGVRKEAVELHPLTHVLALRIIVDAGELAIYPVIRPDNVEGGIIIIIIIITSRCRGGPPCLASARTAWPLSWRT